VGGRIAFTPGYSCHSSFPMVTVIDRLSGGTALLAQASRSIGGMIDGVSVCRNGFSPQSYASMVFQRRRFSKEDDRDFSYEGKMIELAVLGRRDDIPWSYQETRHMDGISSAGGVQVLCLLVPKSRTTDLRLLAS